MTNKPGSSTMKRRAASQIKSKAHNKRPRIVGGFIDDSDDSDGESGSRNEISSSARKYEIKRNDDGDDVGEWDSIPANPPVVQAPSEYYKTVLSQEHKPESASQLPLAHCKAFLGFKPKSTKPVNRSRLLELLSKKNSLKSQTTTNPSIPSSQTRTASRAGPDSDFASLNNLERNTSSEQLRLGINAHKNSKLQSKAKAARGTPQSCPARAATTTARQHEHAAVPNSSNPVTSDTKTPNHNIAGASFGGLGSPMKVDLSHASSNRHVSTTNGDQALWATAETIKSPHNDHKQNRSQNRNVSAQAQPTPRTKSGQSGHLPRGQATTAVERIAILEDSTTFPLGLGNKSVLSKSINPGFNAPTSFVPVQTLCKPSPKLQASHRVPSTERTAAEDITRKPFQTSTPVKRLTTTPVELKLSTRSILEAQDTSKPSKCTTMSAGTMTPLQVSRSCKSPGATLRAPSTGLESQSGASKTKEKESMSTPPILPNCGNNQPLKRAVQVSQNASQIDVQNVSAPTSHINSLAVGKGKSDLHPPHLNGDTARRVAVAVKIPMRTTVVKRPTTPRPSNSAPEQSANGVAPRGIAKDATSAISVTSSLKKQSTIAQTPACDVVNQIVTLENTGSAASIGRPLATPTTTGLSRYIPTETTHKIPAATKLGRGSPSATSIGLLTISPHLAGGKSTHADGPSPPFQLVHDSREDILRKNVQARAAQTTRERKDEHKEVIEKPAATGSDCPSTTTSELLTDDLKASFNTTSSKQIVSKVPEPAILLSKPTVAQEDPHANTALAPPIPAFFLPKASVTATSAVPYFEYCIFQKVWSEAEIEASVPATEILSRPYTNVDEANEQAERFFNNAREQYRSFFQVQLGEWTSKRDDRGCEVLTGTFAPIDYPSQKTWVKIWVQRDYVSAYAGGTEKEMRHTSFVAKTIYVLRLFELIASSTEFNREEDTTTATAVRVYRPLPRTECYTILDAANRAAKNLQVELSHEKETTAMAKMWQATNLANLDKKLNDLDKAEDKEGKYWKSVFNGCGLGSTRFELLVEKVGLCGPRNL